MPNVMWFRSDLRIYDNPALYAAMQQGTTVAIYCLTIRQWDIHSISIPKRALIIEQLHALSAALKELNVPLIILSCETFSRIPEQVNRLMSDIGAQQLFYNHEYEWNEMHCSRAVITKLRQAGKTGKGFHEQCLIQPGEIRNAQGEYYKVFTAFKRSFIHQFSLLGRSLAQKPARQKLTSIESDIRVLDNVARLNMPDWPAGEEQAQQRLNRFIESSVEKYHLWRDVPAAEGSSRLSPYLAVGAISTRQCLQLALNKNQGEWESANRGVTSWLNELIWREFYRHLIVGYPDLCRHKPFKVDTDKLPWRYDKSIFSAWCEGKTGFPIVDAAMRQLLQTGWMHNRLRMVTAMFLTKHLFIDWRLGERFFMQHLVDGDFASNNGGWQWSASTGVDAVPYFRIFNPTRQSQRFDPQGKFIRRYVPELAHLDNKSIHQPDVEQATAAGYPLPIVEHRSAVAQTKAYFKQLG